MLKKILVAYDGSAAAEQAFRRALELAKAFQASILLLSVARPPEPPTMVETTAMLEQASEHFGKLAQPLVEECRGQGIAVDTRVVVGHPAEQIVHIANEERVDLIVMGHRGKNMITRWMLGSVSKRVLSYAHCSVLIVR